MAILTLREHLIVDYPGEALPLLQQLATFERIGRLRPGQHRVVRYWRLTNNGTRLILPRGLAWKAQRLLPGSQVRDERFITRPVHFGLRVSFRDYQEQAVDAVLKRGSGVIVSAPGSGKTFMGLGLVAGWQQPALFLVHTLRLVDQTAAKAREVLTLPRGGLGIIADGRKSVGTHLTIATVQTLAKKPRYLKELRGRIGTVIQDECVVGDTLVGDKPIRDIKIGDLVTAYNPVTETFSQKPVTHVFKQPAPDRLIRVTAGHTRLICTPNHPIWTLDGWKLADELTAGDCVLWLGGDYEAVEKALHGLRGTNYEQAPCSSVPQMQREAHQSPDQCLLRSEPGSVRGMRSPGCAQNEDAEGHLLRQTAGVLLDCVPRGNGTASEFSNDGRNQPKVCFGAHDEAQPDAEGRRAGTGECILASHWTQTTRTRRQWKTDARSAAVALGGVELADRGRGQYGHAAGLGLSAGVQDRHCELGFADRDRSGWEIAQCVGATGAGLQENRVSGWARVDRLAVYERGRDAEFERLCPDGQVYNLEVADFHTFLANGIVTHNCHHSPAESFQKVLSAFPAKYRGSLTATPDREDGLGGMINALFGQSVIIPRDILRERGVIIDPLIYLVNTHWDAPDEVPFHAAEEARAMYPARNVVIMKLVAMARARGQRVLVLVEREKHAMLLAQMLTKAGIPAHPVYGKLATPLQDQRFKWMEQGKAVVVATKLANEGLDWPALDVLILAAPGRSETVLEQRTGRIARTAEGKTFALVYDLVDDGPMYMDQTKARIAKYQEMGYRIKRFRWPAKPDATVPS